MTVCDLILEQRLPILPGHPAPGATIASETREIEIGALTYGSSVSSSTTSSIDTPRTSRAVD
jgi:hypothetical protein